MAIMWHVYLHYVYYSQEDEKERIGWTLMGSFHTKDEAQRFIDHKDPEIDHSREWYSISNVLMH